MPITLDAAVLRRWCEAAVAALDVRRAEIDALNVFPVPDGDTGTNLLLTMRAALAAIDADSSAGTAASTADAAAQMARGALLGARGNSGVILSQLLLGFAQEVAAGGDGAGGTLARGLTRAADLAYNAVADPVEGTMLSVARAAAVAATEAANESVGHWADLVATSGAAAHGAAAALMQTPRQLAVLARAGVVDAGGRGLVVLLEVLVDVLSGRDPAVHSASAVTVADRVPFPASAAPGSNVGPAYEVLYLLQAEDAAVGPLRTALAGLGDSLVVVGTGDGLWRVHVHVDDIGAAIEAGVLAGVPRDIVVTRFADARPAPPSGRALVAVAPGEGLGELFTAADVVVVHGGPDRNPSVAEIVTVVLDTGAGEIVLLPNHGAIAAAANAAADEARKAGREVAVIPTRSPVQGLAAAAVSDPARRFGDDVIAMAEAAAATRWAEVTTADRDAMTTVGRCRAGDTLGLIEGDVVLIGESVPQVACDLLDRMLSAGGELLTVVTGADAEAGLGDRLATHMRRRHPGVEATVYHGGQPLYPLMLGVE